LIGENVLVLAGIALLVSERPTIGLELILYAVNNGMVGSGAREQTINVRFASTY
jgi:hypothetical protein